MSIATKSASRENVIPSSRRSTLRPMAARVAMACRSGTVLCFRRRVVEGINEEEEASCLGRVLGCKKKKD